MILNRPTHTRTVYCHYSYNASCASPG